MIVTTGACSDTSVCVEVDVTVGAYSPGMDTEIRVFPNPAKERVFIAMPGVATSCRVALFNAQGVKLSERQVPGGEAQVQIDISFLPAVQIAFRHLECFYGFIATWVNILKHFGNKEF